MELDQALREIRALARPGGADGMARFGIRPRTEVAGTGVTDLRRLAGRIGRDHDLALALWSSGLHEGRLLASMVADPGLTTPRLMDTWAAGFDSWDLCDQCCMNLFRRTPHARAKALEWSERETEFEKRAGFALMAVLAVHDKDASDEDFEPFLAAIEREAGDDRNFVRKAVSWALRQTGKRNDALRRRAIATARRIERRGTKAARWIARDAGRELEGPET